MEQVTTLFPPAFPALALAHFMALLSPGPDFFLLVGYAVRYILLVVIGSGLLRQTPLLFTIIELLGAAYLLWVGRQLLKSRA
ncbi:LysE family transporter, partial [Salmonella enterica subsp. enterica serovar Infantis]